MWRYVTIPPNILQINSDISAVAQQSATNATQLAILLGQQNSNNSGGKTFAENFQNLPAGALPNPHWIPEAGSAGFMGIYHPTGTGFDTGQGLNTNVAWMLNDPVGIGASIRFFEKYDTPLDTDSVSIQFVVGSNGQSSQATLIFCHADTALLNFSYIAVYNNKIFIGYGTRSVGAVYAFNDWIPGGTGITVPNGASGEVRNTGTTWQVLINGSPIITFTDGAGNAFYNATHRYWGYIQTSQNLGLVGTNRSFALTSIVASDIAVPGVLGTGWQLARASGANVAVAAGNSPCPVGTFDTTEFISTTVTLNNTGGEIVITKTDWYQLNLKIQLTGLSGNFPFQGLIYTRPTVGGAQTLKRIGADIGLPANGIGQGGGFSTQYSTSLYLAAGSTVQPGIGVAGANNIIGNAALTATNWNGFARS